MYQLLKPGYDLINAFKKYRFIILNYDNTLKHNQKKTHGKNLSQSNPLTHLSRAYRPMHYTIFYVIWYTFLLKYKYKNTAFFLCRRCVFETFIVWHIVKPLSIVFPPYSVVKMMN